MSAGASGTSAATGFVTSLRARPDVELTVGSETATPRFTLRVQSAEALDAVRVHCTPEVRVIDVKRVAMGSLLPDVADLASQVVKFRGAEVRDEQVTLAGLGAQEASLLFLTPRRRRPIR